MAEITDILDFWFGDTQAAVNPQMRKDWFAKSPVFDQAIRTRFLQDYEQAAAGTLDHWQSSALGCLALVLLLDQFPRNLFRDSPQAFATDAQALHIAQQAIAQGFDQQLPLAQRWFIYMPYMHSEQLVIQQQSVTLFQPLQAGPELASCYDYAVRHLQVIEPFGRFPHRNQILGRVSTPAEVKFLRQPGSRF